MAEAAVEEPEAPALPWTVYVEEEPVQCWVVAEPAASENTRDGEVVDVRRGTTVFFISFWPEQNRFGEVSFTGGYPFDEGSVRIEVAGARFDMITEGEMAWAASPAADAQIITAMRNAETVAVIGRSTRGTDTLDTFDLTGFAAAIDDAQVRCGP